MFLPNPVPVASTGAPPPPPPAQRSVYVGTASEARRLSTVFWPAGTTQITLCARFQIQAGQTYRRCPLGTHYLAGGANAITLRAEGGQQLLVQYGGATQVNQTFAGLSWTAQVQMGVILIDTTVSEISVFVGGPEALDTTQTLTTAPPQWDQWGIGYTNGSYTGHYGNLGSMCLWSGTALSKQTCRDIANEVIDPRSQNPDHCWMLDGDFTDSFGGLNYTTTSSVTFESIP